MGASGKQGSWGKNRKIGDRYLILDTPFDFGVSFFKVLKVRLVP